MKKIILYFILATSVMFFAGCDRPNGPEQKCGSGEVLTDIRSSQGYYNCMSKVLYDIELKNICQDSCATAMNDAFEDMNDSRGNRGGFPDSIAKVFGDCMAKCE